MVEIKSFQTKNIYIMKKALIIFAVAMSLFIGAQAQTEVKPAMSKEEKQMAKDKKEKDLKDAFKAAGTSSAEEKQVRAILDESNEKSSVIKKDNSLSEEDKKAKLAVVYAERNEAMKALMGKDKYKAFKDEQKALKEASMAN